MFRQLRNRALLCVPMVVAAMAWPGSASAKHFTHLQYVRAYQQCTAETANTTTAAGVPACSPPKLLSDCADDPLNARKFGPRGQGRLEMRAFGRKLTIVNGEPDIRTQFKLRDVRDCSDQTPVGTELTAELGLRLAVEDEACGGVCTTPDFSIDYTIPVGRKSAKLDIRGTNQEVLLPDGQTPIPSSVPWDAEILSLYILDPSGNRFLAPGLFAGSASAAALDLQALKARFYEVKPAEAFEECAAEDATIAGPNGFDACPGVSLSSCESSPDTALTLGLRRRPETQGGTRSGAWHMKSARRGRPEANSDGVLKFIMDCSTGDRYTGPLTMEFDLRVSYHGGACGGSACTPVDRTARLDFNMSNGNMDFDPSLESLLAAAGLPSLATAAPATVELFGVRALDKAGNPFAVFPSMRLACSPDTGFCFGI